VYAELSAPQGRDLEVLEGQTRHISVEAANAFLQALDLPPTLKKALRFEPEEFLRWLRGESERDASATFQAWRRWWRRRDRDADAFFHFLQGFSQLLDADKLEAGARAHLPARIELPIQAVSAYKRKVFSGKSPQGLDALREQAYRDVIHQPLDSGQRRYTLTLPTGMGKTLTGLAAALKLREAVARATGRAPRILYALPFLSIIDQNAQRLKDVFQIALGWVDSLVLLTHHHLADLQYRERREEETLQEWDFAASRLLTEGWHSEIVITTFVQLFETLLAWRNAAARRVNKLTGAILLLDEVQALPSYYWPLVRNLLTYATERLNAYVILMTATQPYLLPHARELVPDPDCYFRALDRLDVFVDLHETPLEAFAAGFRPEADKSYLFVTNTIASAQRLFALLQERLDEPIAFLSTGVVPKERLHRIEALRNRRFRFAVTTQLIEAGVDLDFDVVYRDFAPLDALVQAAGRCNRHATPGKRGAFHVVSWVDEKGRRFSPRIYDPVLLEHTRALLEGCRHLSEPEFIALLSPYYETIWTRGIPDQAAEALWQAVLELRFDGERDRPCVRPGDGVQGAFISQFCLIEEQPYKQDVFVELDDEAEAVWKEAKALLAAWRSTRDLAQAQEGFARLKPRFSQYLISVDIRENVPEWDEDLHVYHVPPETLEHFYHQKTGFRQRGDSFFMA